MVSYVLTGVRWREHFNQQLLPHTHTHKTQAKQAAVCCCFLGANTWQKLACWNKTREWKGKQQEHFLLEWRVRFWRENSHEPTQQTTNNRQHKQQQTTTNNNKQQATRQHGLKAKVFIFPPFLLPPFVVSLFAFLATKVSVSACEVKPSLTLAIPLSLSLSLSLTRSFSHSLTHTLSHSLTRTHLSCYSSHPPCRPMDGQQRHDMQAHASPLSHDTTLCQPSSLSPTVSDANLIPCPTDSTSSGEKPPSRAQQQIATATTSRDSAGSYPSSMRCAHRSCRRVVAIQDRHVYRHILRGMKADKSEEFYCWHSPDHAVRFRCACNLSDLKRASSPCRRSFLCFKSDKHQGRYVLPQTNSSSSKRLGLNRKVALGATTNYTHFDINALLPHLQRTPGSCMVLFLLLPPPHLLQMQ